MPLKNPLRIVITIAVPDGDGEQVLTVIEGDDDMPQNWQLRTDDYTAQNRDRIIADTTDGPWLLKLPPSAVYGHEIEVLIDGTNTLTIDPNGAKLNGGEAVLPVLNDRARLAIVYKDVAKGWIVGIGSTAGSGSTGGGTEPTPTPTPTPTGEELAYQSGGDTNGILYWMGTNGKTENFANPHDSQRIIVSASDIEAGSVNQLCNRIDDTFYTPDTQNSWVAFNLKTQKLLLKSYAIKSRPNTTSGFLRNWKLQGSANGSTWVDLDVRVNDATLNSANTWAHFTIQNLGTTSYQHFRLLQTGVSSNGYNYLTLNELEFYGTRYPV